MDRIFPSEGDDKGSIPFLDTIVFEIVRLVRGRFLFDFYIVNKYNNQIKWGFLYEFRD